MASDSLPRLSQTKWAPVPSHGVVVVAREVTALGPLDLDHPGAEVGEVAGGQWHGDRLLDGNDRQSFERFPRHEFAAIPG